MTASEFKARLLRMIDERAALAPDADRWALLHAMSARLDVWIRQLQR
jgi:hypothetical protein